MPSIKVKLKERAYPIEIAAGLLDGAGALARRAVGVKARVAVVVTNPTVDALYGRRLMRSFARAGFTARRFLISDGERFKTIRSAESLYRYLIEQRVERSDLIVALGGGVIGDLAGFVAATYLRGVRFIQIPTTLLAQIDSSIGGKTGVNHRLGKNLIGAFHQPSLVVADPATLATLSPRQLRSGLYEAIKYGVIRDRRLFNRITRSVERLKEGDIEELSHLIVRSCAIKAGIVARDEREGGLRRILNFGHTAGHAIEAVTGYRRFLHGEAVAYGMRVAARIAEKMELLDANDRQALDETISRAGRLPRANTLAPGDIISAMDYDKKAEAGRAVFVLPTEIGRVVIHSGVPPQVIRLALKEALV
jgi:3-dehydroquinate synthase